MDAAPEERHFSWFLITDHFLGKRNHRGSQAESRQREDENSDLPSIECLPHTATVPGVLFYLT